MSTGWEQLHQEVFAEDAWTRVQRLAWQLTQRRVGYDPDDVDAYEAGLHTREASEERMRVWLPASRLLALALWRAAREADVLVDEIPVNRALWWLGGARGGDLYTEPLPPWSNGVVGDWGRVEQRQHQLEDAARDVVAWNVTDDIAERRPLRDSDNSVPEPPLLLGTRCRTLAAGPFRDGLPPRWKAAVSFARRHTSEAIAALRAELWHPDADLLHAATALHPTLVAGPDLDAPPLPAGFTEPIWIQRSVHIEHVHATILSVLRHHRDARGLRPDFPFGIALRSASIALSDALPAAQELERLWARREGTVGEWERAHIPRALREHLVALEELISATCQLVFEVTAGADEPY
ncbi:hypothetical protein ACTPOK_09475 [Streptomyces inhibens]|uniref:hypothetical protein n=1 Tax=Streptomyces inhibens TaxID=2293571 RepID=UPI00402AD689